MRISIFIFLTLLYFNSSLPAQNSISVGLQIAPATSKLVDNSVYKGYQYRGNVNFGATVAFERKKWGLSSGVLHQILGSKIETQSSTTNTPEGTGKYNANIYIRSIAIPLRLYYNIPLSSRFTLSPNAGIIPNFIYSQTFEVPEDTVLQPYKAVTDIEMFNALYVSVYAGISLRQAINDKWSVEITPGFSYQFGPQLPDFNSSSRPVFVAFSVEFGVRYKLR